MLHPMSAPVACLRLCGASLLLAFALPQSVRAQAAAMGADEAPVRWVDGRPMLKATLRAGDKIYYCNLLLDLAATAPLFLHENAGGSLKSDMADVEIGGIKLQNVGFTAKKDPWLEGITAAFATELQQVPVAGVLGFAAFQGHDVLLDGPKGLLRLLPAANGEAPPSSPGLSVVMLADEARSGLRIQLDLGGGLQAKFSLATRDPSGWIEPGLAKKAGAADGLLQRAAAGEFLDFAHWAPFRPAVPEQSAGVGGIGGAVLQRMQVTIQPQAGRILFEYRAPVYPEIEAEFYRACFGSRGTEALAKFVQQHGDAPQAGEAAQVLLERLSEQGGSPAATEAAALAAIRAAPANGKGHAALEVIEHLPRAPEFADTRKAIAEAGLADARADEDGTAVHKLRLELGILALRAGDTALAHRHLLAAVFGMPTSGPANFALGRWHEGQGQLEQALARYLLVMLDMKNSGQEGFVAYAKLFRQLRGEGADMLAELQDQTDGRLPSFQPIPREPGSYQKTGRTVLVELFTGAMCPPCVAADVACDALSEYYDGDEVQVLQWHLPIPEPEPLVALSSLERAESYAVRGTPTVIVAGGEPVVGGGRADAIADMFQRFRSLCDAALQQAQAVTIEGEASLQDGTVRFAATVKATRGELSPSLTLWAVLAEDLIAFPGKNGILFHHHVVRARLTPPGGAPVQGASMPIRGEAKLDTVQRELSGMVSTYEKEREFLVRPVQPDPQRLCVVCFVEDGKTGAVLQALRLPLADNAERGSEQKR